MARIDYDPLRAAHQAALDAANNPAQPTPEISVADPEPTRPEGHYGQSPGWTDAGGMEQQQASAARWAKASNERLALSREPERARDAGDQHIDRQEAAGASEKTPDITPAQPGKGQTPENERSPVFRCFGEQDRSEVEKGQEREGVEAGPSKEHGDNPTLTFMMDQDLDRGR